MPSAWEWWAADEGSADYDIGFGSTREECIRAALRNLNAGARFDIVEAQSSTDRRHEFADQIPFVKTRNKETLTAGPHE